ncbi:MAG: EamA family transporter [Clostridiales bacterium]|nr:EamA family transporter [Clostridiales bacterium]
MVIKGRAFSSPFFVILAAMLWGCISIFSRMLTSAGFSTIQIVAVRTLVAAAVLAVIVLVTDRKLFRIKIRDLWCFIGTGIVSLASFSWCYFTAMELDGVSIAAVLLYTSPVFVMIFSVVLFGEKFSVQKLLALVLTLAGCVSVTGLLEGGGRGIGIYGILAGIGAGVGYALYSIFSRFAINRGYSSTTISLYTFIFAAIATVPLTEPGSLAELMLAPGAIIGAAGCGIICCILPYLLYTKGLEKVENSKAAIMATIEPVVASIIGLAAFGEGMTFQKLTGMLLIFTSVVILNLKSIGQRKSMSDEDAVRQ